MKAGLPKGNALGAHVCGLVCVCCFKVRMHLLRSLWQVIMSDTKRAIAHASVPHCKELLHPILIYSAWLSIQPFFRTKCSISLPLKSDFKAAPDCGSVFHSDFPSTRPTDGLTDLSDSCSAEEEGGVSRRLANFGDGLRQLALLVKRGGRHFPVDGWSGGYT